MHIFWILFNIVSLIWTFRSVIYHKGQYFDIPENISEFKHNMIAAGPFFVKLCQWLCQRPDIFNSNVISTLKDLQQYGYMHSFDQTEKLVNNDIGTDYDNYFTFTGTLPIASGTIAQAYLGTLNNDPDKTIIIKVVHPNILDKISNDAETIVAVYVFLAHYYKILNAVDISELVTIFKSQCDMRIEAINTKLFADQFRGYTSVGFPHIMCAGNNHIIESFIDGFTYDVLVNKRPDFLIQAKVLAMSAYLQMFLCNGFFHGDCHNGNILYTIEESDKLKVHFIDCGYVFKATPKIVESTISFCKAINTHDADLLCDSIFALVNSTTDEQMYDNFRVDINEMISYFHSKNRIDTHIIRSIIQIIYKNQLKINSTFINGLFGLILITEDIDTRISSDITIFEFMVNYLVFHSEFDELKKIVISFIDVPAAFSNAHIINRIYNEYSLKLNEVTVSVDDNPVKDQFDTLESLMA